MGNSRREQGFVVSAVLYPLLVLFLALIMGLLAMTDTRKRILDKMKLEISDSIFDEATCSCDTILNKLNYIIKNGVAGGGGGGSYTYNVLGVNVKAYDAPASMPNVGNGIGDIAVITDVEIDNYYVSRTAPGSPKEGTVWIVQDKTSNYHITSDYSNIGISYVMQYINGKWELKKSYVYDNARWTLLYYVPLKDGIVDITGTDINAEIEKTYSYTGEYQTFTARFSGYYKVELWGAGGGQAHSTYGKRGNGAYTRGEIYLNAGDQLYVYVGGSTTTPTGGWNGGGDGYNGSFTGKGGGGATDVRLVNTTEKNIWNEFDSLKSRIMVAAGGGGGAYFNTTDYTGNGGSGGGLNGYSGSGNRTNGTGANQSVGGYLGNSGSILNGGFGYGAQSGTHVNGEGGGGAGYYGGGGGYSIGAGGGGSSYISGHEGCSSIEEESTSTNIIHNGSSYHYNGYYFKNTLILDGNDANVPTYDDASKMTGNSGNGYAKIILETIEVKERDELNTVLTAEKRNWNYSYSGTDLYNGRYQIFNVLVSGYYQIESWGAGGGQAHSTYGKRGNGAYTRGEIYLEKGDKLYLYVGSTTVGSNGGWNGGGDGYNGSYIGKGGGGATDIRLIQTTSLINWDNFDSLKSRIMVAAGGGGGAYFNTTDYTGNGGSGGGLNGYSGSGNRTNGTGATQSMSGYLAGSLTLNNGKFGYGAKSSTHTNGEGGGGSGYYGGGGGYSIGAGGGGSSYISGHEGCSSIEEESTVDSIVHNGSPFHYSGYYFRNTVMYDGNSNFVPSYSASSMMTGNSGNGYAKITFLYASEKTNEELSNEQLKNSRILNYGFSGNNPEEGRYQVFDVQQSGTYKIELWGAGGGEANSSYGKRGLGAYTYGEISLIKGTRLYLYIGGTTISVKGSWNGGGNGYNGSYTGRGGGGATDVRTNVTTTLTSWNETISLRSRIMVAAGGGGGAYYNTSSYTGNGGPGGGLNGYSGSGNRTNGTGGTQIAGGYKNGYPAQLVGGFGYGAQSDTHVNGEGGGGSGWYGGGGGYSIGAGGGGSSYISGHAGCIAIDSNGNPKVQTYTTLNDSISYTGYKFVNTQMIDGNGYPWTTVKSASSSGMPNYSDSTIITGNVGNGYAKITYLGA